jgi:hypothetical protein
MRQSFGSRQPNISDWRLFHRNNDTYWARWVSATTGWDPEDHSKITLSASDVREIRLLAGVADDEAADAILDMEGKGMPLGQYLLSIANPSGCLKVGVYGRGFHKFKEFWSTDGLAAASDLCQQPGCPAPQASVAEKHRINIVTYSRSTPESPVCDQSNTATYEPRGTTYELLDQHTARSTCGIGYGAGLNAALWQAAGPSETIAIIEVLPALSPNRYALALQREHTTTRVVRMEWPQVDDPFIAPWNKSTALGCFSEAASFQVKVRTLNIPQDKADELAKALDGIDLRSDRCPRNAEGECARFTDGRSFHVEVPGNAPINIFDLRREKGYVSENPQLSEWIYKLLDEAKQEKETATK